MLALLLVLCATLTEEISESIGKRSIRRRRETIYGLGFLELFGGFIVMTAIVIFTRDFHFNPASLPTLLPRLVLEVTGAWIMMESIAVADRSTIGFLRILGIPMLLLVDIVLGYHITGLQITGVFVMFFALVLAFHQNPSGKRGAWLVILNAFLSVITISLYKYDITHFNSIPVEQAIVMGTVVTFFYIKVRRSGRSPLRLLTNPVTGTQALMSGISSVMVSFAFGLAPASVISSLRRTMALMWAVVFGQAYFHERSFKRKLYSFAFTLAGIAMLVSPYWHHR